MPNQFGILLKKLRKNKRFSQLSLATEADISQRHISFLESGRATASANMVHKIAKTLKLDLHSINQLLLGAGHAPQYTETADQQNDEYVWQAVDFMLESQMPYPTIVLNEKWNIIQSNMASKKLLVWLMDLTDAEIEAMQDNQLNMLQLVLSNARLRPYIQNWAEIASHMAALAVADGVASQQEIDEYVAALSLADRSLFNTHQNPRLGQAIIPLIYQKGDVTLSLISMQTRFMMSQNVAFSGLSIESFIANDQATKEFFTQLNNM